MRTEKILIRSEKTFHTASVKETDVGTNKLEMILDGEAEKQTDNTRQNF